MSCPPALSPARSGPRLSSRLVESSAEIWRATTVGVAEYWAGALRRGATPLDVAQDAVRWWREASPTTRPSWHTANEVVLESPVARLRDFSDGVVDPDQVPTLVLPPQAGHDSCIVDFSSRQSQMQVIRAAGLTRAYSLDWIGATEATRDATVDDYLAFIERAVEHIGGPVNLIGDCQGGWLATIYAALHPEQVHTLTVAGAPIDFHAGDAIIGDWVGLLGGADMAFYRWVVEQGGGVLKGEHMLNGFILIKPENEVAKQVDLLANLHDAEFLERHRAFETWFKHVQDIPGAFYLWIVEHLFAANGLISGELEIGGRQVDLRAITCPVNLLAGAKDHITPPAQVFAMAEHVGTPPTDIVVRTSSGGHLGLFMGSEALREHWPALMAGVAERSLGRDPAVAERRARQVTPPAEPPIPAP
jgi:poly(3-hydroxybutyrate) depolymerase